MRPDLSLILFLVMKGLANASSFSFCHVLKGSFLCMQMVLAYGNLTYKVKI